MPFGELIQLVEPPAQSVKRFTGWNTQPDGSGQTWDFATSRMPAEDLTLYAQWKSTLSEGGIPFGGFTMGGVWSITNLALCILSVLMLAFMLVLYYAKHFKWRWQLVIVNLVLIAGTLLLFVLTTDFSQAAVFVNYLTLPFVLLCVAEGVVLVIFFRKNTRPKGRNQEYKRKKE